MSRVADHDDGVLARQAAAGGDDAFAELMRRHREPLYRLIVANVADADEALDLVQETFLSAHRAIARYDPARSMRAWLVAIALNKCRDWGRRRAVRRMFRMAAPMEAATHVAADNPAPDAVADARLRMERVATAIARLPAPLRETLALRAIEGASQAETATLLGISQKTVEKRLAKARARLRTLLEEGQ